MTTPVYFVPSSSLPKSLWAGTTVSYWIYVWVQESATVNRFMQVGLLENPYSAYQTPPLPAKATAFYADCGNCFAFGIRNAYNNNPYNSYAQPLQPFSLHTYALIYNNGWDVIFDGQVVHHYPWNAKAYAVGIALESICPVQSYCKPSYVTGSIMQANLQVNQDPTGFFGNYGGGSVKFTDVDSVRNTFSSYQDTGNSNGGILYCGSGFGLVNLGGNLPTPEKQNCFNPQQYYPIGASPSYTTKTTTITTSSTTSVITQTQYSTPSVITSTTTFTYTNPSVVSSSSISTSTVTSMVTQNPCQLCEQTPVGQINYIGIPFMIAGAFFLVRRQHE